MPRIVALATLPRDVEDAARVYAGLARAYPGAVLGDTTDPRIVVLEHADEAEDGALVMARAA